MDLWTQILDLTSQVVTPIWGTLLQYIPLLLFGLLVLLIAGLALMWQRNSALNHSRVPRALPAGPVPAGVHLPPPSRWPFVIPIGLFFVFASLIFAGRGVPIDPALATIGIMVALIGAAGWFMDAHREYEELEAGDHHLRLAPETAGQPAELRIPEGVHLPGPSAWPFYAPIGLFFVFYGLILSPVMIVAGGLMSIIAAVGWFLDAQVEYRQVEATDHPGEPVTRDPEKAFHKSLVPIYVTVAVVAIALTVAPWVLTLLPRSNGSGTGLPTATSTPTISTAQATRFDQSLIVVIANKPFTLTFDNNQDGVQHNVAIYNGPSLATTIFKGDLVKGVGVGIYNVPALPPGQYTYICNVHPNMIGRLVSQ
jgi:plastocyanin